MTTRYMFLAVAVLVSPATVRAQETGRDRAEACRQAIAVVTAQASAEHRSEALSYLPKCGPDGGVVLARELTRGKTSSDSAALLDSYFHMARIVDASVLAAALDLAGDRTATAEARIIALKLLITYNNPVFASLPFSGFLPGNPPTIATQDHFATLRGAALPPGWQASATDLLGRLASSPLEGATIRHAARRALSYFQR